MEVLLGRHLPTTADYRRRRQHHSNTSLALHEVAYVQKPEEVLRAVQEVVAAIDAAHVEKAVYRVHSDRGGEFDNTHLRSMLSNHGVRYTTTEGHDPSGNGQAESFIGKLKQRARAMLSLSDLDTSFWPFAVSHACLLTRF